MFSLKNTISAVCSGLIFALLAGALVSYWVWLEMRVHTWVVCWLVFAFFLLLSMLFKIKPITFFIGEAIVILLMIFKSPNIFYYNVRDMFFLNMPISQLKMITIGVLVVLSLIMLFLMFSDRKNVHNEKENV